MNDNKPVTARSVKMVVRISSYIGKQLSGTLDCIYFKEPLAFSCMVDMIKIMETAFDTLGFPDKSLLPRTFGKAKARMRRYETDTASLRESLDKQLKAHKQQPAAAEQAAKAVFEIYVNFRHNAEWQGRLHILSNDETKEFSGIIHLVSIIDEVLSEHE